MSEFVMQKKIVIKCIKQKKIKQGVMFRPEVLVPHRIIDEKKQDEEKKEIQVDSFERSWWNHEVLISAFGIQRMRMQVNTIPKMAIK